MYFDKPIMQDIMQDIMVINNTSHNGIYNELYCTVMCYGTAYTQQIFHIVLQGRQLLMFFLFAILKKKPSLKSDLL